MRNAIDGELENQDERMASRIKRSACILSVWATDWLYQQGREGRVSIRWSWSSP